MNNTLEKFKHQQAQMLGLLNELKTVVHQGEEAGMPKDPKLEAKIQAALSSVSDDKLKVALIGGFSEGKTSIAAAWMERLDKSTMNISHQESSNAVKIYDAADDFVLIDTPGLFGFKEQVNDETQTIEKYKDITKKYVSEAHLVLYVMNSTNPIKESHKDDLQWLFRTLNLLPRTVFVLSRFDEIADMEDESDYEYNLNIKKDNVQGRLTELIGLNAEEIKDLSIVAVAANPFDLGTDHWLKNLSEFKAVSHIQKLQSATDEKIEKCGGYPSLAKEMLSSVISDILIKQVPEAENNHNRITEQVEKFNMMNTELTTKLNRTSRDIEDARAGLRDFATIYFGDLIIQAKGCSLETFSEFYEREIGSEGIVIGARLQKEFNQRTQSISFEMQKMQLSFNSEVSHFNITLRALGKQGVAHVLKGNLINSTTVLAARDGAVAIAKTVGINLSKYLKFKPWGAVNFSKAANGALVFLGLALEVWDSWEKYKQEMAFKDMLQSIVSNFEQQRKDFIDMVNGEDFYENFFPDYMELRNKISDLNSTLKENRELQERFQRWKESAQAVDTQFRLIT